MAQNLGANPLDPPPADSGVLRLFLNHFAVPRSPAPLDLLEAVSRAFAQIPYENLTKIIKHAREGVPERARRGPEEVIVDHRDIGAGGTCFSLTAALLHVVRALGFDAQPILADRKYGDDTHCALLVWLDGRPHLLDPGFLLVRPIDIALGEQHVATSFNEVLLVPDASGEKLELHTVQRGNRTYRLTFKTRPADAGEFLRAWDASFDWEMMRYPLLTRVAGARQLYLQDRRFQVRDLERVTRAEISAEEVIRRARDDFGIRPEVARRALEILARDRRHGRAATR